MPAGRGIIIGREEIALSDGYAVERLDPEAIGSADGPVDFVIAPGVLGDIADPAAWLAQTYPLLRPGGVLNTGLIGGRSAPLLLLDALETWSRHGEIRFIVNQVSRGPEVFVSLRRDPDETSLLERQIGAIAYLRSVVR